MTTHNNHRATLNGWIQETSDQLSLDETGACYFDYQDDLTFSIQISEDESCFYLYVPLLEQNALGNSALLEEALRANLFLADTKGGALSLDPATGRLALCYTRLIEETDSVSFANVLNSFLGVAIELNQRFLNLDSPHPSTGDTAFTPQANEMNLFFSMA